MRRSKRPLPTARRSATKLELPTIMDRALAVRHGAPYVHLAAFAIDIDRVFSQLAPEDEGDEGVIDLAPEEELPFGWEVFLTGVRLQTLEPSDPAVLALLEDTCHHVLDQPPDEQGYGSQLLFAVYDAIGRGALPPSLADLFRSWRGRPKQLLRALSALWDQRDQLLPTLAARVLAVPLDPPLAPPTQRALEQMAAGTWPPSAQVTPP